MHGSDGNKIFETNFEKVINLLLQYCHNSLDLHIRSLIENSSTLIKEEKKLNSIEYSDEIITISLSENLNETSMYVFDNGSFINLEKAIQIAKSFTGDLNISNMKNKYILNLISCLMVSEEIIIYSKCAENNETNKIVLSKSGEFYIYKLSEKESGNITQGNTTILRYSNENRELFKPKRIVKIVKKYAKYSRIPIKIVNTTNIDEENKESEVYINEASIFTLKNNDSLSSEDFEKQFLGCEAIDSFSIKISNSRTKVAVFILKRESLNQNRIYNHIYKNNILITNKDSDLLPDWAFFARVIVETKNLKENIFSNEIIKDNSYAEVKKEIENSIKNWFKSIINVNSPKIKEFTDNHYEKLLPIASNNNFLREVLFESVEFETTKEKMTLNEYLSRYPYIKYCDDHTEFLGIRTLNTITHPIVKASNVYEKNIIENFKANNEPLQLEKTNLDLELNKTSETLDTDRKIINSFLSRCDKALKRYGCKTIIKEFHSDSSIAAYTSKPILHKKNYIKKISDIVPSLWSNIIENIEKTKPDNIEEEIYTSKLYVNWSNPVIQSLQSISDKIVFTKSLQLIYSHALISYDKKNLSKYDEEVFNESLHDLIQLSINPDWDELTKEKGNDPSNTA